jgi:hypothetical protein
MMDDLYERAVELAKALQGEGFRIFPEPPHTNSFRVYAPRAAEAIELTAVERMEATREAICGPWQAADVPGWSWVEFVTTPTTLEWQVGEVATAFGELLRR